jgi:hypothetical protein
MRCFLEGYGPYRGAIPREHFIPKSILRHTAAGSSTAKIGGLRWQPTNVMQDIGISSLQSKILCSGHYSELSLLDSSAGELFHILHCIDKYRASVPCLSRLNGLHIERWLLKGTSKNMLLQRINGHEKAALWRHCNRTPHDVYSTLPWAAGSMLGAFMMLLQHDCAAEGSEGN